MTAALVKVGEWELAGRIVASWGREFPQALDGAIVEEAEWCRARIVEGLVASAPGGQPLKPLAMLTVAFRRAQAAGKIIEAGRRKVAAMRSDARGMNAAAAARSGRVWSSQHRGWVAGAAAIKRVQMKTSWAAIGKAMKSTSTKPLIQTGDLLNSVRVVRQGSGKAFIGVLRTARGRDGKSLWNLARIHEFGVGPKAVKMTDKQRKWLMAMLRRVGVKPQHATGGGGVHIIKIPARPFIRPVFELYYRSESDVAARFLPRLSALLP